MMSNLINLIKNFINEKKLKFNLWLIDKNNSYYESGKNFEKYREFIINNQDNDFIFLLLILELKIENIIKEIIKNKLRISLRKELIKLFELRKMIKRMIEIASTNQDVQHIEEYQKLSKSFFGKLHRIHDKLYF